MDPGEHLSARITQPLRLVGRLTGKGGRLRWKFLREQVRAVVEWMLIELLVIVLAVLLAELMVKRMI